MPESNPKQHDKLFKWMLSEFTDDFFAYFFPGVAVRGYQLLDKEFTQELEKDEAAVEADLLLLMEVDLDGQIWEILIVIELKSKREDVSTQIQTYICRAFLLRRKPVWCIAFFTDDAVWRTRLPDRFPFLYHSREGIIDAPFDIIKLKEHQSTKLMRHRSLLLKLLALKADDRGCDREELIREIYRYVHEQENALTDRQKMLVEEVVQAYAALPPRKVQTIKEEAGVTFVASNIEEHYIHIGEERGKILGAIELVKEMLAEGSITREHYQRRMKVLEADLKKLGKKTSVVR